MKPISRFGMFAPTRLLRGRYNTTHGVHGELLDGAVDRRPERLQLGLLLGLHQGLGQPVFLLNHLAQLVEQAAPVLGDRLGPMLADRGRRGFGHPLVVLLDLEFLLHLGQRLKHLEVLKLRAQLLVGQIPTNLEALL